MRLVVGYGLISHGIAKLNRGPEAFADTLAALAVPNPHVMAWCTIVIELLGGLGILLGAFVSLLSLPVAAILLVAILKVHLQYGFSSVKLQAITATGAKFGAPGYETALLYLAGLATLMIGGAGPLAIDGWLRKRAQGGAHSCKP